MNVTNRTYPQPDAPQLADRSHDRALAVFKYLLNLEPEQVANKGVAKHPLFDCIRSAFEQQARAARGEQLDDSYTELISGPPQS